MYIFQESFRMYMLPLLIIYPYGVEFNFDCLPLWMYCSIVGGVLDQEFCLFEYPLSFRVKRK